MNLWILVTYLILISLLLWVVIGAKGKWWIKALLILATIWFGFYLDEKLNDLKGWPYLAELPYRFEVKWAGAKEPNQRTSDPGTLYFLVTTNTETPRLYQIEYSRQGHRLVEKMMMKLREGGRIVGSKDGFGNQKGAKKNKGGEKQQGFPSLGSIRGSKFMDVRNVPLPPKDK